MQNSNNFSLLVLPFYFLFLTLFGCATVPYAPRPLPEIGVPGIYHRVQKGQTLWRISKLYNLDLEEIARINRISDASSIETGQLIFIPHRQKKEVEPSYAKLSDDFIWPTKGRIITNFGQTFNNMVNKGINIKPYTQKDEVYASRSGKVVFLSNNFEGFGKTVILDHGDGFLTVYAGNSQLLVEAGQGLPQGGVIASCGDYLHFEIRKGHLAQNPRFYLP